MIEGGLRGRLGEWVARGIISLEQAARIAELEEARGPLVALADGALAPEPASEAAAAETAAAAAQADMVGGPDEPAVEPAEADKTSVGARRGLRVPLAVEVLGYIGGVLVLGALIALLGPVWGNVGRESLAVMVGVFTVALLVAGWVFARTGSAQARRLGYFLMFMASLVSVLFFVLLTDMMVLDRQWDHSTILTTSGVFAVSLVCWVAYKTYLQLLAVTASLAALIGALCEAALGGSHLLLAGFLYVGMGAVMILLAERDVLQPSVLAWDLGALAIVVGLQVVTLDDWPRNGWLLFLSCLISAGLLALGLWRNRTVGLALGALGLIVFIPETLYWVFRDSMGVSIALLLAGALLVAVSFVLIRAWPQIRARRERESES